MSATRWLICEGACNQHLPRSLDRVLPSTVPTRLGGAGVRPLTDPVLLPQVRALRHTLHASVAQGYRCTTCGEVRT